MLTQEDNLEINNWFQERGQYKIGSTLWDQHNNQLGKRLFQKLNFFIQACKRDWNRRYKIDMDECESLLYMGLAKAMKFYGTKTIQRQSKDKDGQYMFIGKFQCSFSTYLTTVVHGILHVYLQKMNYKAPRQHESDPLTKKQFAKRFRGKKRQIPPHLMRSFDQVPVNSNTSTHVKYDSGIQDQQLELPIGEKDEIDEKWEREELLKQILSQCSPFQQKVLAYIYKGWKRREIAEVMNVTPQAIGQMVRRLRRKYKQYNLWQNQ